MSEAERKSLIDQILAFPANTYSREYLEQPRPRTGKPYSVSELSEYLKELQQAAGKSERKTQQVQQSPEVARIQAQQVWEGFFSRHLDIPDNDATRRALFERGLSLSDDEMVRPAHLDEAAKLLIAEGTIRTKKVLTAAELKQQAAKDLETFKQAAIQFGFSNNSANQQLAREVLGLGYSISDIAQAITNGLRLSPVGEAEQQQRSEHERQEILEEIIGARILTAQDKLKFESMPLEQLRAEIAQIREERRMRNMTGQELRAYLRQRQQPSPAVPELPNHIKRADLIELLNSVDSPDANRAIELLDGKSFANGKEAFRYVCDKFGFDAVNQRLGTYVKPQIAGIVREVIL